MVKEYNQPSIQNVKSANREIAVFSTTIENGNIDHAVVHSFGEEWKKFHKFSDKEIEIDANMYFDVLDESMINKNTYGIDLGCGSGRWTKWMKDKVGFMESIDPSDAVFIADNVIGEAANVRLAKASIDNIPFDDETFDFAMCIGVLHHIPDTQKAMIDCVKKVKIGGYFYTYIYYNLDNRGLLFKFIFSIISAIRRVTSALPMGLKKVVCELIAIFIYMPVVLFGRFMKFLGLKKFANQMPLSHYQNQSFFVIRTDALDRFGTKLEHRFSKKEIEAMMMNAGLDHIKFGSHLPYWHAVGKRVK
jgi:SAM-dependent methyltransferase